MISGQGGYTPTGGGYTSTGGASAALPGEDALIDALAGLISPFVEAMGQLLVLLNDETQTGAAATGVVVSACSPIHC